MVKTPSFKLEANGKDITDNITKNLVSISFNDEVNEKVDQLTLKVTGAIKRPAYKDKLKLYLGYGDQLTYCGSFLVQNTTRENNYGLSISATGVDFSETLKEKRDTTYEKLSMTSICSQIATNHSLKLKCDMDDIYYISLAQSGESDLNFLNRLALDLNAIFNIKNDTLIFRKKIKNNKKSTDLPSYTIDVNNCENISISHNVRNNYNSCKARWRDTKEAKDKEVMVGSGTPTFVCKKDFKSAAEAKTFIEAKFQTFNQIGASGSFTIPGEMIFAGGILTLKNTLEDDGEYQIKSVSHNFDSSGWKTTVNFEQ